MNGFEFEKRVKRLGRRSGKDVRFEIHGKGSHGRLYFGQDFTSLKDRREEIRKGLPKAMCRQLGMSPEEL